MLGKAYPAKKNGFLAGLTLLELIIVVVVIAIIAGFTIPGYFEVRRKAEQRGAVTQIRLIHTAERVRHLESGNYFLCSKDQSVPVDTCSSNLNLDLPDDGWIYAVTLVADFTATATKDGCTYTMRKTDSKPTGVGCIFTP